MTDWRSLPPVPEEERPDPPAAMSQTLLALADKCRRSAMLYLRHRGGAPSHEMDRGSAFHAFAEAAIRTLVSEGTVTTTADAAAAREIGERFIKAGGAKLEHDVARQILEHVLATNPGWTIPAEEQDALRMMVWHFAQTFEIPEGARVLGVERLIELDLGGWIVRGKLDYIVQLANGIVEIWDWKTGWDLPSQEKFEKAFQIPMYSLLAATGSPIVGEGEAAQREPFPLAPRAPQFRLVECYPRRVWDQGGTEVMAYRDAYVDRKRVLDFTAALERLVGHVAHAIDTGDWPARSGSHCKRCPARPECPLPEHLRAWQGGEPEALADRLLHLEWEREKVLAALRPFARARGPIPLGTDMEAGFREQGKPPKVSMRWGIYKRGESS